MFILRTVYPDSTHSNSAIGDSFHYVGRMESYEQFRSSFKNCFGYDHVADFDGSSDNYTKDCYAFICTPSSTYPLYEKQQNYIMTGDGKTFSNVTLK